MAVLATAASVVSRLRVCREVTAKELPPSGVAAFAFGKRVKPVIVASLQQVCWLNMVRTPNRLSLTWFAGVQVTGTELELRVRP